MPFRINCRVCEHIMLEIDNLDLTYIKRCTNNNHTIRTPLEWIRKKIGKCQNCGHIPDEEPSNIKITPYTKEENQ